MLGRCTIGTTHPGPPAPAPPMLAGLQAAAETTTALLGRVSAARQRWINRQGADVGCTGSRRSLLRHTANYLAAAAFAGPAPPGARLVDVGGGVGALTFWLASRLDVAATLVEPDGRVLRVARTAFPELECRASAQDVPDGSAWLVTAMEVIEHVPHTQQAAFAARLAGLLAPGATLVLSTPDESGYLGGWSGYAPHVGVLDARGLRDVLAQACGAEPQVWRFAGGPFTLGPTERVVLPLANRAHATARALAPGLLDAVSHAFTRVGEALPRRSPPPPPDSLRLVPADDGGGTGLLAVVHRDPAIALR